MYKVSMWIFKHKIYYRYHAYIHTQIMKRLNKISNKQKREECYKNNFSLLSKEISKNQRKNLHETQLSSFRKSNYDKWQSTPVSLICGLQKIILTQIKSSMPQPAQNRKQTRCPVHKIQKACKNLIMHLLKRSQ